MFYTYEINKDLSKTTDYGGLFRYNALADLDNKIDIDLEDNFYHTKNAWAIKHYF